MRDYLRVLHYLLRHRLRLAVLIVSIIGASLLSSVGVTFVSPLLRILFFENEQGAVELVEAQEAEFTPSEDLSQGIPLPQVIEDWKEAGQEWLEVNLYAGSRRDMLQRVCLWLFLLYFFKNLFGFLQESLRVSIEHRVIRDLREELHQALRELPLAFFSGERTGYLMSRVVMDVDAMRASIVGGLTVFLSNALMITIAMSIVFAVSWQLSLATLMVVPPNILLVALISKRLRRGSHRAQEEMGELSGALQEGISAARVVKAFDPQNREVERFRGANRRYYHSYVRLKVLEALSSPVSEVLGVTTAVVILGFGGHLVLEGRLRPDLLIMFLAVMLWVIAPIKNLIKLNSTLQTSLAAARRVFEILDTPREDGVPDGRRDVGAPKKAIRFEDVTFSYRGGTEVLSGVNLEIPAGTVLALVGPSGAGKSTLVDLVPRFIDPDRGRITLDGVELREIHLPTLRDLVAVVTQEVQLFHDSIEKNISFGSEGIDREKVIAAAKAANAHDFIEQMPQGYATPIGERGMQLSGGQRQRIAIARAILKDPPILILDEATSALDSESERLVQEALEHLMRGRTSLVIAHRLSTVTRADRIVVLAEGKIVEAGTHAELHAAGGHYRRLHDLQFNAGSDDPGDPAQLAR